MTKNLYISIFLLFLFPVIGAAQQFKLIKDSVSANGSAASVELVAKNKVVNLSTENTLKIKWVRVENNLTSSAWATQVCDKNFCYLEHVNSAVFELAPGDTGILDVHFSLNNASGSGLVKILVFPEGTDSTVTGKTGIFTASAWSTGIKEAAKPKLHFYPNPVKDKITVEFAKSGNHKIEIFNILGSKIGEWQSYQSSNISIPFRDYPAGMYILTYQGPDGKVLTKTFSKN